MLAKNFRHFSKIEISKVFQKSKKIKGLYIDVFWHKNIDNKILVINSKKYEKKAVLRNRLKREFFHIFNNEVILKRNSLLGYNQIISGFFIFKVKSKASFDAYKSEMITILRGLK